MKVGTVLYAGKFADNVHCFLHVEQLNIALIPSFSCLAAGETDWKIIAINIHDPLADKLNGLLIVSCSCRRLTDALSLLALCKGCFADIGDVEQHMPGFLQSTIDWFRYYKIPDGKPANQFGLDEQARGKVTQTLTQPNDR